MTQPYFVWFCTLGPTLLVFCGLLLGLWSGEFLYRDRKLIAAALYCLGSTLAVIAINIWVAS